MLKSNQFPRLHSLDFIDPAYSQLEELMDMTHTALDGAWKADGGGGARGSYPQARMAHLLNVIGAAICRCERTGMANEHGFWEVQY